jgi:hypothetical protein
MKNKICHTVRTVIKEKQKTPHRSRLGQYHLHCSTTLGQSVYPDNDLHISNYYINLTPLENCHNMKGKIKTKVFELS